MAKTELRVSVLKSALFQDLSYLVKDHLKSLVDDPENLGIVLDSSCSLKLTFNEYFLWFTFKMLRTSCQSLPSPLL